MPIEDVYDSKFHSWFPEPRREYTHLTAKQVTDFKQKLRREHPDDDGNLFDAAWRKILIYARNAEILDYDHLKQLYDATVSEMVNNPRSQYYIHGRRR